MTAGAQARPMGMGVALFVLLGLALEVTAQVNIDGGRSQLPGMKQDMFDQAQQKKKMGGQRPSRGPPDCPKSDKMSPFWGLAFVSGEVYVKLNSTDEKCTKLVTVGGANYSTLTNASRTCGPAGEWKRRIAEQLSAVFFQGGLEWVKHENETIEVVTEEGTFEVGVNEEKFAEQSVCWARGCDCEQAKNPAGRVVLFTLAAIGIIGLMSDTLKLGWEKFAGKKPAKHVQCKKGHRLEEKPNAKHVCDICGKSGTHYQCGSGCPYDLCKVCYKSAKKKLKAELEAWYEKHPEEKKKDEDKKKEKKKKGEKGDRDDSDEDKKSETEKSEGAEGVEGEKAESSKPDEDKTDDDKSEAEEKES